MAKKTKSMKEQAGATGVTAFLDKVAATPVAGRGNGGRLLFAMDATASRQPSWDLASQIQGRMFDATTDLGGLEVQLCYYRGYGEFDVSPWVASATALMQRMTAVSCHAGQTQLQKVLQHAVTETRRRKINAVVFVGDCMEEDVDVLGQLAGQLGVLGVPLFIFHEGHDAVAARAFADLARLSGGAVSPFDSNSAAQLRDLLGAVAVYASGGGKALAALGERQGGQVLQLAHQLRGK